LKGRFGSTSVSTVGSYVVCIVSPNIRVLKLTHENAEEVKKFLSILSLERTIVYNMKLSTGT
jgi:hypothetical protein